ncbi:hypothetical protein Taro_036128, partial [Colocasia esculenta]|nr:hypothetical protein [Colocasia esculenta]
MEDTEGGLSFDFEGGLDAAATAAPGGHVHRSPSDVDAAGDAAAPPGAASAAAAAGSLEAGAGPGGGGPNPPGGRRSFRQTVCRHWLRGLCMKGEACGFLHQYDKDRMPVCRFFRLYGECREQDCPYKHTTEDIKECNMYKLGFCPNGPDCRYRHAKLPGPPPPVEEVFQKLQQMSSSYGHSNRFFHGRNAGYMQQAEKSQLPQVNQSAIAKPPNTQEAPNLQPPQIQSQPHPQPQQQQLQPPSQQSQQQVSQNQTQNIQNGLPNQNVRIALPLPQGQSSCNRENLELSVQQGVWATQRSNEAKLNEAFDSSENVILIFSINRTRHFQGCAKMMSRIGGFVGGGNWKHAHGTAHYGRNFSVKWLKILYIHYPIFAGLDDEVLDIRSLLDKEEGKELLGVVQRLTEEHFRGLSEKLGVSYDEVEKGIRGPVYIIQKRWLALAALAREAKKDKLQKKMRVEAKEVREEDEGEE